MDTLTQTITSVEAVAVKVVTALEKEAITFKSLVAKDAPVVLNAIADWITAHPKKALSIVFFIIGFILGTLI